jgi:ABC-2 type transport system ATP-binding protein
MLALEVANLTRHFGQTEAVHDLGLQIAPGEIYGLVGPDGAGKTTTLRLLCGALLPSQSKDAPPANARVWGYDVLRQPEAARACLGYLPQRFSLYEDLTVLENIRFFAEMRGLTAATWRPRCLQILDFVGLVNFTGRLAGHLSGGMRQKLGLAAALVHQPRLLLLDEPTTGVDPVTRQDFWQLILQLVGVGEQETAVLVSTPYMDEAARCTRIGFMRGGRLVIEGTPAALCARLRDQVLELTGEPLETLRTVAQEDAAVLDVQRFGDRLHLRVAAGQSAAAIHSLEQAITAAGGRLRRLRSIPPQLEDVFMSLA